MEDKKTYKDYMDEIEELKRKYKLDSYQIIMLQIAAAFKLDGLNYDKLKKEFIF